LERSRNIKVKNPLLRTTEVLGRLDQTRAVSESAREQAFLEPDIIIGL
jgi:hypothetical protein